MFFPERLNVLTVQADEWKLLCIKADEPQDEIRVCIDYFSLPNAKKKVGIQWPISYALLIEILLESSKTVFGVLDSCLH